MDHDQLTTLHIKVHKRLPDGRTDSVNLIKLLTKDCKNYGFITGVVKEVSEILNEYLEESIGGLENKNLALKLIYADIANLQGADYTERIFRNGGFLPLSDLLDLRCFAPRDLYITVLESGNFRYETNSVEEMRNIMSDWIQEINNSEISRFEGGETGVQ